MIDFEYINPARIIFGKEPYGKVESILRSMCVKSMIMVYSGDFVKELGIYRNIESICKKNGIKLIANGGVVPNPKIELIREMIQQGKESNIDFVLAVGGGSSVDTAKAIALGIPYNGDVWDFFEGKSSPDKALPIGVISTIPASGSETSNAAIVSNGIHKVGFEHELIIPKFAVMNPLYTRTLPKYQTACGISDILSHLLERYYTNTEHVDTTDYLIVGAIKALMLNGERIINKPDDYDARAEIQWLASIAHNNLLNTGRVDDWASHRIEHELSAQYNITHGEGMAIVMLAYLKYVAIYHPHKTAELSNRLYGFDYKNYTESQMTLKLVDEFERFYKMLGLITTLSELSIDDSDFEKMALRATKDDTATVGHYYPLNAEKIIDVLRLAL
ncbi:alcohol dehydrogenase [Oribacterium sp. C9]|uniref:iron-containing alcohol dehydrogenase n=1 Tax=Oribacterium sp. C9 TaxID=1943579 RepID=UPI0009901EE2|nr:iron-containing alcohol dehydrogenase [Oribacterium sp. C9]OON86840.1 alcohol dehydrogenase [Oribacterium sp. C9]